MLHVFAIREGRVYDNDPVARHRERQRDTILPGFDFSRHTADRTHARVRHVTFRLNVRTTHGLPFRIAQLQIDRRGADVRRLRRDFVVERDIGMRRSAPTSRNEWRKEERKNQ